jgi:hypothetical protein
MSRRRYLSSDAGRDKGLRDVARASLFAHSLYLLAIPCAADDCSLPTNDPDELLWEIWPAMARDYGAEDVQAAIDLLIAHHLWEYGPTGRLRYPPQSFYRHQTYIRDDRRACAPNAEQHGAPERTTAQPTSNGETSAQNSEEQRTSAQNAEEHRFVKDSLSSSSSSSFSLSSSPATPSASLGVAPDADAPDASVSIAPTDAPLSLIEPVPKLRQRPEDPIFQAFLDIFADGEDGLLTEAERAKWNAAAKGFRNLATNKQRSPVEMAALIREAHEHWPNVKGDLPETPNGLLSNFATLLRGPQVNGRSNGTVRQHTQRLTETALVPHQATVADVRRRRKANDEPGR